MTKLRLVVVGNGMAGARAVEEVLARGGGDQFDIVMFGDEPYGNYNRILLSSILSGARKTPPRFSSTRSIGTVRTTSCFMRAHRSSKSIGRPRSLPPRSEVRESYDKLLIATGSRAFIPPIPGVNGTDKRLKSGVFGFRNIDDCNGVRRTGAAKLPRRRHRRGACLASRRPAAY